MTNKNVNLRLNMISRTLKEISNKINYYHVCEGLDGGCGQINHKGAKHCIYCNGKKFREFKEGEIEECIENADEDYKIEVRNQSDSYSSDEFRKIVGEEYD